MRTLAKSFPRNKYLFLIDLGITSHTPETIRQNSQDTNPKRSLPKKLKIHQERQHPKKSIIYLATTMDIPSPPTSHHPHQPIPGAKGTIIYTETDEAPALATYSLLPILAKVRTQKHVLARKQIIESCCCICVCVCVLVTKYTHCAI